MAYIVFDEDYAKNGGRIYQVTLGEQTHIFTHLWNIDPNIPQFEDRLEKLSVSAAVVRVLLEPISPEINPFQQESREVLWQVPQKKGKFKLA